MNNKRINVRTLLVISVVMLIFTNVVSYVLLMTKNKDWSNELREMNSNTSVVAEGLTKHIYYDGDSIPCNQTVKHYSPSGKILGNENLRDVLCGDKVVILLSSNCCFSCAQGEVEKLLELAMKIGHEHLVIVTDFTLHSGYSWLKKNNKDGYYETSIEHLGLEGTPTRETIPVMLTQNGRIKTSFLVEPQTSGYADMFHNYLLNYFKKKR